MKLHQKYELEKKEREYENKIVELKREVDRQKQK